MRILLLGEFSRLHNSLKEGLLKAGHSVTLAGAGDDFKGYPADIDMRPRFFGRNRGPVMLFRKAFLKLFGIDPAALEKGFRFFRLKKNFKGFDVVQLINESTLQTL
ncbi:MAG: glycosyltransferase family 1 protein, partial [Sinomicrobium sp.]|nr:glycosyltransferase family 1 protein [Sinomicrobium sp.]